MSQDQMRGGTPRTFRGHSLYHIPKPLVDILFSRVVGKLCKRAEDFPVVQGIDNILWDQIDTLRCADNDAPW